MSEERGATARESCEALRDFVTITCAIQNPTEKEVNVLWHMRFADFPWVAKKWLGVPENCFKELELRLPWSYGGRTETWGARARTGVDRGSGTRLDLYLGYDDDGPGLFWYDGYPPAGEDEVAMSKWQAEHQAIMGWLAESEMITLMAGPEPPWAQMEAYGRMLWAWLPALEACHEFVRTLFLAQDDARAVDAHLFLERHARAPIVASKESYVAKPRG